MMKESSFSGDSSSESESETSSTSTTPLKKWDQFRNVPPPVDTGSAVKNHWWIRGERLVKILAYIFSFIIVLVSATVSKTSMFFMIKQIAINPTNIPFCNDGRRGLQYINDDSNREFAVDFTVTNEYEQDMRIMERVAWIWAIGFSFCVPQALGFLRSLRKCLFKFNNLPTLKDVSFILLMESLHTIGLATMCFVVLPQLDSANAIVLTSLTALIPGIVLLISRFKQEKKDKTKKRFIWKSLPLDTIAIVLQVTGCIIYPLIHYAGFTTEILPHHPYPWAIPVGLILTSCGWWETFTEENSYYTIGQKLWNVKKRMIMHHGSRYIAYSFVIPVKIALFLGSMVFFTTITSAIRNSSDLTRFFETSFGEHNYKVAEIITEEITESPEGFDTAYITNLVMTKSDPTTHVVYVLLVQIFTSIMAYISAKFASKVCIQSIGFSLPLTCVTPMSVVLVITMCGARAYDKCIFETMSFYIPNRLFFECPASSSLADLGWDTWMFVAWFLSYIWITRHIWSPKSPKLASTEQIFGTPYFDAIFIDQSLMLNRRKDGIPELTVQDIDDFVDEKDADKSEFVEHDPQSTYDSSIKASDNITRIYACATMWHESEDEQLEMLKSLFRIDSDYHRREMARKHLKVVDKDYYNWETHILFDDCMTVSDKKEDNEEKIVNMWVKQLVRLIDDAASRHYGKPVKIKACKKYPTPYGGRLVWTLPGKTQIICHLKVSIFNFFLIFSIITCMFRIKIRLDTRRDGLKSCTCTTFLDTG